MNNFKGTMDTLLAGKVIGQNRGGDSHSPRLLHKVATEKPRITENCLELRAECRLGSPRLCTPQLSLPLAKHFVCTVPLGQRDWQSCLQSSVVKEMPEYKALLKEAETYVSIHNLFCNTNFNFNEG